MVSKLMETLRRKVKPITSISRHAASDKVTQTYELLELILDHLDSQSLRSAQLVNKYWHTVIHKSSTMRARLYSPAKMRQVRPYLIGATGGVGIYSIVTSFTYGPIPPSSFPFEFDPTWEPSFRKQLKVDNDTWLIDGDSGGYIREQPSSLLGHVLAHSDTYMLFYSVTCRESFEQLEAWLKRFESDTEPLSMLVATLRDTERKKTSSYKHDRVTLDKCLPAAVVSTKNDLPAEYHLVKSSEGAALARKLGCPFIETSAKTGDGVERAFAEMCRTFKRARLEHIRQQSKRTSLIKATVSVPADGKEREERKERWWRWYRSGQRLT